MHVKIKFNVGTNNPITLGKELLLRLEKQTGLKLKIRIEENGLFFYITQKSLNFNVNIGLLTHPNEGQLMKGTLDINYLEVNVLDCLKQMGCEVFGYDQKLLNKLGWVGKKWVEVADTYEPFDFENFDYDAFLAGS